MFKGNKCNPFLVLIAIDSVDICMQHFQEAGLGWQLHGVCSMSCTALLRATHVVTQSGGSMCVCSPSLHHGLRYPAGESPVGSPSLHLPCPLHSHGSSAGRKRNLLEGSCQTPAPPWASRQGQSCAPHSWESAPASMCEESSQSLAVFSRQLLPAPARGLSHQVCLCPASSVCSIQGLGCHQPWVSQLRHSTIQRSVGCNNSTRWWCLEADFHTNTGLFSWLKISATKMKGGRMWRVFSYPTFIHPAFQCWMGSRDRRVLFFLSKHSGVTLSIFAHCFSCWLLQFGLYFLYSFFMGKLNFVCVLTSMWSVACTEDRVYMYKWRCYLWNKRNCMRTVWCILLKRKRITTLCNSDSPALWFF